MNSPDDVFRLLRERTTLTRNLSEHPYSFITYLRRANWYDNLGYPDLAIGDEYRALLLIDATLDESEEYHEQALAAFNEDFGHPSSTLGHAELQTDARHTTFRQLNGLDDPSLSSSPNDYRLFCFAVLCRLLLQCGCFRSAYGFAERGLQILPSDSRFLYLRRQIIQTYNTSLLENDPDWSDWTYDPNTKLPDQGSARRELYPWNDHEPDRFSEKSLRFLNERMKTVAPKCEVRVVDLPVLEKDALHNSSKSPSTNRQLGVFATEDIAPNESVLQETSLLTASNRLYDPLCDACSAPLPSLSTSQQPLSSCPDCDDIIFCSQSCHDAAMSLYHPAVCGNSGLEAIAKDPSPDAATNALYLLLLSRSFALSETQKIHPLDLPETKYLWGDFASPPTSGFLLDSQPARKLPFSFEDNILAPLHLLEKMDINIFTSLSTTDTWVISTLFAKFRGVASARMDPRTGMPEICAVHPMWCLANHSCAPNVKWEWSGSMKLTARSGEDVVRWGGMDRENEEGGIRKGKEVLSHYCDIDLGVEKRREWAIGALGGVCLCERCIWEEDNGEKKKGKG